MTAINAVRSVKMPFPENAEMYRYLQLNINPLQLLPWHDGIQGNDKTPAKEESRMYCGIVYRSIAK